MACEKHPAHSAPRTRGSLGAKERYSKGFANVPSVDYPHNMYRKYTTVPKNTHFCSDELCVSSFTAVT
jgi:hypothetical protein